MTKDFRANQLPARPREQASPLFLKTTPVQLRSKPWKGQIVSVEPQGDDVKLTLNNGVTFIVKNQDFQVGQTVQVQPLDRDQYQITHIQHEL